MKKTVCIFDFDGTLVDSMDSLAAMAAEIIFLHHGIPQRVAYQHYRQTSGLPFYQQLEKIFPNDKRNKLAAKTFEDRKRRTYFDKLFYKDASETINYLKEKGLKVVISSGNYSEIIDKYLSQYSLSFDLVLGHKPDSSKGAHHFQRISKEFSIMPNSMIFVGDSLHDARSAYDHDVDFVGKEGLFSREDFHDIDPQARVIKNLSDLKEIL